MNQTNYQKELDKLIIRITSACGEDGLYRHPKLLLHSCCAPCSSYCMEYLREYFDVTVFYYNPNISPEEEYHKRVKEEMRLIEKYNAQVDEFIQSGKREAIDFGNGMKAGPNTMKIHFIEGDYSPWEFYEVAKGYETCPEGGERCFKCFELRLNNSFEKALENGCEFVSTTLTISPLKNAAAINEIGYILEKKYHEGYTDACLKWLPSDFKKRNGYKRSIELSSEFDLYRQNFCGCAFSRRTDSNDGHACERKGSLLS